jgi:hypothetical protein
MKKKIFALLVGILLLQTAKSCDICGSGAGGNYIGILPDFSNKIVGIRYRYNSVTSHLGQGGATTYLTTKEKYHTAEAWAGWNITPDFRVMASIPYAFNEQVKQTENDSKNGIGDVSFTGYYQIINSRNTINESKLLVQSLWLGGGIKLPTGSYKPEDKQNEIESANLFQLGTASTDFFLHAMYDVRLQDLGLNTMASYKINTNNKYDYRYGNKFNISAQVYHKFKAGKNITVSPNVGTIYEVSAKDWDEKFVEDATGGKLILGTIGFESVVNKITLGGSFQTPLDQKLGNGFIKAGNRCMLHLALIL